MASNRKKNLYPQTELDLVEVIRLLLESKKLLISTILFFSILSIIYSGSIKPSFESSIKMEIGHTEMIDGELELIESTPDLISNLNVLIMKNPDGLFSQKVSIESFENKIIKFGTTSKSVKQNENLLTELISYIDERHSYLESIAKNNEEMVISQELDVIESEISFLKERMRVDLKAKISKLENDLPILNEEIKQLNLVVIQDSNNLNLLKNSNLSLERAANSPTLEQIISTYKSQINQLTRERNSSILQISILSQKLENLEKSTLQSEELFLLGQKQKILKNRLQMLTKQPSIKTHTIGNIETNTIKPKTKLIISFGIIFGFITSIFLVFIVNFSKSYRNREA